MEASRSEMDTFKIMSNTDFVDWSKGQQIMKSKEPEVIFEEKDSDTESDFSAKLNEQIAKLDEKMSDRSSRSSRSSKSSTPRSVRSESKAEIAAKIPLPASDTSPEPPPIPSPPFQETYPRRTIPVPKKYTAEEENDDYEVLAEKEALLQDLLSYERPPNNMKLTRQWNVKEHTLDELQFEYDRIQSELNANQMVDMAKSGIKFGVGGIEMFLKQAGFNAVDGWYKNSCADMNKYNRPLIKLYKRYWRKTTMSPIMELAFLLFGGLAWTVAQNKMGFGGSPTPSVPSVSIPPVSIPRATEYEPMRPPMASPNPMRPPSMASANKGPRWTDSPKDETPKPVEVKPVEVKPVEVKPEVPNPELTNTLQNLSQQNAMMLQVLQNMNANLEKKSSRRSSISSRSSASSPRIRIPLKTPQSRRVNTVRSTRTSSNTLAL